MAATIGLLRPHDLDEAARLFGECEESGRCEQEARAWLEELLKDPAVLAVVAREGRAVLGVAVAASAGWSEQGTMLGYEVCVDREAAGLEPRLREALELVLWADSLQRQAA